MSFFAFLIFLLLLLLILPAIVLQRIAGWWRRMTGGDTAPRYSYYHSGGSRTAPRDGGHKKPHRKKIFSKNEGEYVDFEEITVTRTTASESGPGHVTYETEEQVSDAEWTEIK